MKKKTGMILSAAVLATSLLAGCNTSGNVTKSASDAKETDRYKKRSSKGWQI